MSFLALTDVISDLIVLFRNFFLSVMSQSSSFDLKAFYGIQRFGAFKFLFFFSSAVFSFFLTGPVGTGLSLEQQLAGALLPWGQQGWNGLAQGVVCLCL